MTQNYTVKAGIMGDPTGEAEVVATCMTRSGALNFCKAQQAVHAPEPVDGDIIFYMVRAN